MTTTTIEVRSLTESDLSNADRIFRLAFGTFLGMPDPSAFGGDSDFIATRWRAGPTAAVGAFLGEELVGSNFVSSWGSVGVLGPLTIRPGLWDQGIGKALMEPALAHSDAEGASLVGLFTFGHSPKHVGLYQHFGFWPQHLTALFARPVAASATPVQWSTLSESADHSAVVEACAGITNEIYDGLDMRREILAVADQHLGETVLIGEGDRLEAFAICHIGAGSEAGSGACYVKFGAARPGRAGETFTRLLDACGELAARHGASVLLAGGNSARHECYAKMQRLGFRAQMLGVAMTRPNQPGYNRAGVYVIDDWR